MNKWEMGLPPPPGGGDEGIMIGVGGGLFHSAKKNDGTVYFNAKNPVPVNGDGVEAGGAGVWTVLVEGRDRPRRRAGFGPIKGGGGDRYGGR